MDEAAPALGPETLQLVLRRDALRVHQGELVVQLKLLEAVSEETRWAAISWLEARSLPTTQDGVHQRIEDIDQVVHENARELSHHATPRPDDALKAVAEEALVHYLADLIQRRGRILPKDEWKEWTDEAKLPFKVDDESALDFSRTLLATPGAVVCMHFGPGMDAADLDWQGRLLSLPAQVSLCRYRGVVKSLTVTPRRVDV